MRPAAISRVLAVSVSIAGLAFASLAVISPASAAPAPSGQIRITEWMYNSSNGKEFVELTNVGAAAVDMTGWSFDDTSDVPGSFSLSGFGTVQVGESVVFTDDTAAAFRTEWGLPDSVKVIGGNTEGLGNGDEINIYDAGSTTVDKLTYPGDKKTNGVSASIPAADLGLNDAADAVSSTVGDPNGSWTSSAGSIGSPGVSSLGSAFRWVKINEVTSSGSDTVELVNTSPLAVDLAGWQQVDSDPTHSPSAIAPSASSIPARGYVTFSSTKGLGAGGDGVRLYLADGTTLVDTVDFGANEAEPGSYARCPDGTGDFQHTTTATFGAANACSDGGPGDGGTNPPADDTGWQNIKINEVTSSNGFPDEVEIVNTGDTAVDVSSFTQNDSSHTAQPLLVATLSVNPVPAHGYAVFQSNEGLSSDGDAVKLYRADGTTLVDQTTFGLNDAEPGSWSRCADATGDFVHTATASFGASNATACAGEIIPPSTGGGSTVPCQTEAPSGSGAAITDGSAWPGSATWVQADHQCEFVTTLSGQDVSGLDFDPSDPSVLYAAKNKSHVYKLVQSGGLWIPDTTNDWAAGKDIVFPGGSGQPDSEGITVGPDGFLYTTTERDNTASNTSLDTVLRFDPSASGTTLTPTEEWNLTSEFTGDGTLAATGSDSNLGFEGITWVPDSYLTANGFVDESTGAAYDPTDYPLHGTGLYFLALEKNGHLYGYALNSDGTFHRIANVATGMPAIAETQWDPDLQRIWAVADNTSAGSTELLGLSGTGAFIVNAVYDRPAGLPDDNLEGFAVAPESTCVDGVREVVRSDDGNNDGHSLWSGTIDCDLTLSKQGPGTAALTVSSSTAAAGDTLTVSGAGLTPGVEYTLTLHSDPIVVGTAVASTSGAVSITFTVPAGLASGAHTLQLTATGSSTVLVSAALQVGALQVGELATTGSDPQPFLALGVVLLLLGAGLAAGPRVLRRRTR